jgi:DNA-binding transcriptional ArsR family regulator
MLDLRHETVSRHVSALRQQGLISVSQGSRARLHRLRHTGPTTGAGLEAGTPGRDDRPLPPPPPVVADAALARARAADGRVSGLGIGSGALVWAGLLAELAWLD